ncbi:MAG: ArsR/SmtB family transcription factor [Dehalococcoidia bacterium]
MQERLRVFKALSEETRMRIMGVLLQRECSVCEVAQSLSISQTRASRGLTALHNAGLSKTRRDGLWVLHSIDKDTVEKSCPGLLNLLDECLNDEEICVIDRERLRHAVRESPCNYILELSEKEEAYSCESDSVG